MAEIKKRYSDEDLAEFKQIIDEKLERARKDYADMMKQLYPALTKAPALYPFCWAHRLIHAFFVRHKVFMYQLKAVLTWKG